MKKIYVFLFFLIFLNIFNIMFISLNIFQTEEYGQNPNFPVDSSGDPQDSEQLFENLADGITWNNIIAIFFGDTENIFSLGLSLVLMGAAVLAAWKTHSPAPFVLLFMVNILVNMYQMSKPALENYPINSYLLLVGAIGFMLLFIITAAEYLTQGDA